MMMAPLPDIRVIARLMGGIVSGGSALVPGPGHSSKDRSLFITISHDAPDGFLVHSFANDDPIACKDYVRQKLGLPGWEPNGSNGSRKSNGRRSTFKRSAAQQFEQPIDFPEWTQPDESGKPTFCKWGDDGPPRQQTELRRHVYRRFADGVAVRIKIKRIVGEDTTFTNWYRVRGPGDAIGWQAQKPESYVAVPYIGAINPFNPELVDDPVFWTEGERDCDSISKINLPAFTFGGGDGLPETAAECLVGRRIIVVEDNDQTGRCNAEERAAFAIAAGATPIRVLRFPELAEGEDVTDFLEKGGTPDELIRRADASPEWQPSHPSSSASDNWDSPDWSLLDDRRGVLPDFPLEVFSPKWQEWVNLASHGAGVTLDHVAVPLIGIASSLIGGARRIQPSRSWSEPISLWTAIVGFSGTGKTPGIDVTKRAVAHIEGIRKHNLGELQRKHETRLEAARAAHKKWKKELEGAIEHGIAPPPCPAEATHPGEFVVPRLYISNATIERVATLLQASPRGILLILDELAGLFLNMGRYSNGSDREFWLESWNGKHFVLERMGRPSVTIDHLLVGITGGLQPDKLARSFKGDADGMYARFCFAWPQEPSYRPLTDNIAEIEPEIVNALTRLIDLNTGEEGTFAPRLVQLSNDARASFEQFRHFLHDNKSALDGREREWWAKGPSHVLRLAGTLAYLSWSIGVSPEPSEIDCSSLQSAVDLWRDYFWPHARASLRQVGLSDRHTNSRRVLLWIKSRGLTAVSLKDARRDALSQSLDGSHTEQLLDSLAEAGWLRKHMEKTGGRPQHRWTVNPLLFGHAESAATAESRYGAAAQNMQQACHGQPGS